jgi:arylsulfatase
LSKAYLIMAAQSLVSKFLATFGEFPPRQRAASFTINQAMERMEASISGAGR